MCLKPIIKFTLIVLFSVAISTVANTQNKRPKKDKKQQKTAISKEQSNKAQKQAEYKKGREGHTNIQDKKTRKRMKKTMKKSMVHAGEKKLPFYKRWFRNRR